MVGRRSDESWKRAVVWDWGDAEGQSEIGGSEQAQMKVWGLGLR